MISSGVPLGASTITRTPGRMAAHLGQQRQVFFDAGLRVGDDHRVTRVAQPAHGIGAARGVVEKAIVRGKTLLEGLTQLRVFADHEHAGDRRLRNRFLWP